ncbi:hypothetical protein BLOT_012505 [Blomia tropicalis]|nr:hypothetical protein BLOT_012505 [Blomia tropicalis]
MVVDIPRCRVDPHLDKSTKKNFFYSIINVYANILTTKQTYMYVENIIKINEWKLTVQNVTAQHRNTIPKYAGIPAVPVIHVIRMKMITPNMF